MAQSVGALRIDLIAELGRFRKDMRKASGTLEGFGRTAKRVGTTVGAGFAAFAAGRLAASFVRTAADFEQSMNRVAAVSGAVGEDFEALEQAARRAGATTVFTAGQSADALGFLAMAGFEANEAITALPGVLNLAAAGGIDLATAADKASNILTGYGKTAADLADVNDVLVGTFTKSNTNILQLGEAFEQAGPIAAAAGLRFTEVSAALGLLGNAGFQAEKGGTALRNGIIKLVDPPREAAAELERLGIVTRDSEGRMLDLADIFAQLEDSAFGVESAIRIFGVRAGPGMAALISQGTDELRRFDAELQDVGGIAEDVADRQVEGLNGALKELRSAFEELQITMAGDSGFNGQLEQGVDRLTTMTRLATELAPKLAAVFDREPTQFERTLRLLNPMTSGQAALGLVLDRQTESYERLDAQQESWAQSTADGIRRQNEWLARWRESNQDVAESEEELQERLRAKWLADHADDIQDLRDRIDSLNAPIREWHEQLDIAERAGFDMAEAQRALAAEMIDSLGGFDAVKDRLDELPQALRDAAEEARAAELTKALNDEVAALRDEVFPLEAAMRDYADSLEIAAAGGLDMEAAQRALAEQVIRTAGGIDDIEGELDNLPPVFRDIVEEMHEIEASEQRIKDEEEAHKQRIRNREDAIKDVSRAIGDAVVGTKEWGDAFKDLIAEMLRARAIQPFIDSIGDMIFGPSDGSEGGGGILKNAASFAGSLFGGGRADGGRVLPGMAYTVGERGRELFVPDQPGSILPSGQQSGQTINVYAQDANSFLASRRQVARAARRDMAFGT